MLHQGFQKSSNEPTLYVKVNGGLLIISLYMDDLLVAGNVDQQVMNFKLEMEKVFDMSDLGLMKYFLNLEIKQDKHGIFMSQHKYAMNLLKRFHMENCKCVSTPMVYNYKFQKNNGAARIENSIFRSLVGNLLYICVCF